jgi:hypothetical protein
MQKPDELSAAPEPFNASAGTIEVPAKNVPGSEPLPVPASAAAATKTTPVQLVLIGLGIMAFLYFARPVVLPVFLAWVAGTALKPLIRWLTGTLKFIDTEATYWSRRFYHGAEGN